MKPLVLLLLIGAMSITDVYYNPVDETKSEYIILTNIGEDIVNITGWTIATPNSETDATLDGQIFPGEYLLVTDRGWNEERDNLNWPESDYEEPLTLPNTQGFVQLKDTQQNIVDTIGWGEEAQRFETQAHPGVQQGEVLKKIQETQNNYNDYTAQTPNFPPKPQETTLIIDITEEEPEITNVILEGKNPDYELITLQHNNTYTVYVELNDTNGYNESWVTINGRPTQQTHNTFEATLQLHETTLQVGYGDAKHNNTKNYTISFEKHAQLKIPKEISLSSPPGKHTTLTLPITNTGNADAHIQIRAEFPYDILTELPISIENTNYTLQRNYIEIPKPIGGGETLNITLHIQPGYVAPKEYLGHIIITT